MLGLSKSKVTAWAAVAVLLCVVGIGIFFLNRYEKTELVGTEGRSFEKATVTEIIKDNLEEDGNRYGNQQIKVRLDSGEHKGKEVEATSSNGNLFGAACKVGMKVVTIVSYAGESMVVSVYSADRQWVVIGFAGLFLLLLCAVGGKKGIQSALGLIFTLFCVLYVFFPMIYRGFSPFLAAVLCCFITTVISLLLISGMNKKTWCAVLGTLAGVVLAGIAAWLFGVCADIDGYNVSDIESLLFIEQYTDIKVGELLFAGILISALGAAMDVGMSVSSTIWEIHVQKPELTQLALFKSGMHVGRDMMGTMSNTLILAFVGGSLSTLVLNYAYNLEYLQLINSYNIGIEIMQGVSGSIGIILIVPFTAFLSSWCYSRPEKN